MSDVFISKCAGYNEADVRNALIRIFEGLGGIGKFIRPGDRVALKPNLVMKKHPDCAATTHPVLVKELGKLVKEAGGKVLIAESPGGLYSERTLKAAYTHCGMAEVAEESGIELNYDTDETDVDNSKGLYLKKVRVIKPLADADVIINLPKLKTHGQMVYTGAVKNMFGAVPGALKAEYHFRMSGYDEFANALIDIYCSVKPAISIMDAVVGMEGLGPTSGTPRQIGALMASSDAFSLDLAALSIIGAKPEDVPVLRNAIKRGLCPESLQKVSLLGDNIDGFRVDGFDIPQLDILRDIQFYNNKVFRYFASKLKPRVVFDYKKCVSCGECRKNCPAGIIEFKNRMPLADRNKCIRCFAVRSFARLRLSR
jgi:uncharacterized protein (DUF362 family)